MHVPFHIGWRQGRRRQRRFLQVALWSLLAGLVSTMSCTSVIGAQSTGLASENHAESAIFQYELGRDLAEIDLTVHQAGMVLGRIWPEFGLAEALLPPIHPQRQAAGAGALDASMQSLISLPGILGVEADTTIFAADHLVFSAAALSDHNLLDSINVPPTDTFLSEQWAYEHLQVLDAWTIGQGDPEIVIAVIDSGYDLGHEDLSPDSLWINAAEEAGEPNVDDDQNGFIDDLYGWDWVENDSLANDQYGHGTHVGGTIAAIANNAAGVAGLGGNLRIAPLRVLDEQGTGQIADLLDALYYAYQKEIRIVNMSLVLQLDSPALHTAIQIAHDDGMLLVAASGNLSSDVSWPARYTETVAVAATDSSDMRGPFSNHGPEIEVAAPGVNILSTYLDNGYVYQSGTSMAAAHVSALAGLLWSLRPDADAETLRLWLRETANDANVATQPGTDAYLGAGRIDYAAAMERASADLTLQQMFVPHAGLYAGEALTIPVTVAAGGDAAIPVHGAIVRYQWLSDPADDAESESSGDEETDDGYTIEDTVLDSAVSIGASMTSSDGLAELPLTLPERIGKHILRVQVGASQIDLQVDVYERTAAVDLILPTGGLSVDAASVSLSIEIRDAQGQVAADVTTVHLETDLGRFDNGLQQIDLAIAGGSHTFLFHPDRVAGDATVTTQVNGSIDAHRLPIQPGEAAEIIPGGEISPLAMSASGGQMTLDLTVLDEYGNPVADGTMIHLVADDGHLAESEVASHDGAISATLAVGRDVAGPVHLWAVVPGTQAAMQMDIDLLNRLFWLPSISIH